MGAFLAGVTNRVAVCRGPGGVEVTISLTKAMLAEDFCLIGVANKRGSVGDDGEMSILGISRCVWVFGAALLAIRGEEGCVKVSFNVGFKGAAESATAFACNLFAIGVLAIWNASRPSRRPFLGAVEGMTELDGIAGSSILGAGMWKLP